MQSCDFACLNCDNPIIVNDCWDIYQKDKPIICDKCGQIHSLEWDEVFDGIEESGWFYLEKKDV